MMKVASLSAVLLLACAAAAEEPKPPVALEATVTPSVISGGFRLHPQLHVRLVGGSKDAAVVTDGLSVKLAKGDKKATVTLALAEVRDGKGRLVVPSATKLGVVQLKVGEVADVRVQSSTRALDEVLQAAGVGELELVVEYEVPEAWAKRFGVVGGKVSGTATVTK